MLHIHVAAAEAAQIKQYGAAAGPAGLLVVARVQVDVHLAPQKLTGMRPDETQGIGAGP